MNIYKVFYSKEAEADLDDIYLYLAVEKRDSINAKRLIRRLTKVIDDLSFMADSYHFYSVEPYLSEGVRYFSEGKFSIFYKIIGDSVYVVRVVYGKRDIPSVLAE